jgi:hypothetical protein
MGGVNGRTRLGFVALLLFSNGCRCNSVEDKELPAAAPAGTVSTAMTAAPIPTGKLKSEDCGPDISGVELVTQTPVAILGELHGLAAAPAFTADLACRLAFSGAGKTVTLALEIADSEQPRLDAFLASEGRTADRTALLAGAFWAGKDGRASVARVDMLERIRVMKRQGANLRVLAIDPSGGNRDEAMAKRIIAAVQEHRGPVIALVGNLHARTIHGADDKQKWMGEYVREAEPLTLSLDNRYGDGDAWVCTPECGRRKMKAQDPDTDSKWRLELFAGHPDDKGFSGVWRIGPARASDPINP